MPDRQGAFAADLAAVFRDPDGVTELRGAFPQGDDATLSPAVFLQRCVSRRPDALLEARAEQRPGNLIAAARWVGMTAMAEPWLGAVRTWHQTQAALRDRSISAGAEQELYWRLAGGWPTDPGTLLAHLAAWPVAGSDPAVLAGFAERLADDGSFRYSFDGVAARVSEIGERVTLGQLVLRMTVPGRPVLYPEDASGEARLWTTGAEHGTVSGLPEAGLLAALEQIRAERPEPFTLPLTAIETPSSTVADDRVCAFLRGDQLLVAVAVGDRATGACGWALPPEAAGAWRDVLTGRTFVLPDRATLAGILGPEGRAVLVRA